MGTHEDLSEAVNDARIATRIFLRTLEAHEMRPGALGLHKAADWPGPLVAAYRSWEYRIGDIARILVCRPGGEPAIAKDHAALIIRAYILGLDLDD